MHWDVDNENLHGGYFEWATGKHDILAQMFTDVNQVDPNVALFINDFNVVNLNAMTVVSILTFKFKPKFVAQGSKIQWLWFLLQAMKMLALNLIEDGAPIYGIGIQSHIDYVGPSIHVMKVDL